MGFEKIKFKFVKEIQLVFLIVVGIRIAKKKNAKVPRGTKS